MRWMIISTALVTAELALGMLVGTALRRASVRQTAPRPLAGPGPQPGLPPLPRPRRALVS